jgi:hypothetical protein
MARVTFTLLTRSGQETFFGIRIRFPVGQPIDPHPGNAEQLISVIFPKGHVVFSHAGHHTGTATDTFVQIDDHPKLLVFHSNPSKLTIYFWQLPICL